MKLDAATHPLARLSLLSATIVAIFAIDLMTPLGTVVWALYTIPLLLSGTFPQRWLPLACATLCSMFIALAFYLLPPSQTPFREVLFNRLAGISVLWAMGLILFQSRHLRASLAIRTDELRTKASLLNEAHDAILVRDLEDRILYWNRGAGERYGWFEKEAVGRRSHELLQTQFPEPLHDIMERTVSNGTWEGELTQTTRDGRHISVASRWTAQKDAGGRIQAILEINTDITEIKQTQEMWREATTQMAAIFNSCPLPILVMDPRGHILRWNSSAERVFGWSERETVGKLCPTVPDSGLDDFHWMIEQALHQGHLHDLVRRRRKKDGTVIDANISISALHDRDKHPLGVVAILEDITHRKRAEEELETSERRLRTILETEPECVKVTAEDGVLLYMNPAGLAMIGAEGSGQVIGKPVYPLIAPAYREAFVEFNRRVFHGEPGRLQFEIAGLKGQRLWMDSHAIPLKDDHNTTVGVLAITRDVTEQKRGEEAIRKYETIFQGADWGMVIVDPETNRLLEVNPAFARMHGYTVEEIQGKGLADTFAPEVQGELARHARLAHEKGHHVYELMHVRKDGSRFPCRTEVTAYKDVTGRVVFRAGTFQDLTERNRAEEALRESEARFRQMAENIHEVFWMTDPAKNRMLYVSPAYETIWGRSCATLYDSPRGWLDAIHPDDRERVVHAATTKQLSGRYNETYRIVRPDGTILWIHDRAFPVSSSDGEVARVVGVAQDITTRKTAEDELRRSEERFQLAARATNDAIWDWDLIANRVMWNEGFQTLFGYKAEEIEPGPESWYNRIHPKDRDRITTDIHAAIDGGEKAWSGEYRFRRADGTDAHIYDRGYVVHDREGKAVRMIGAMQDITERVQAEEDLRASERALRASEQSLRVLLQEREQLMRDLHDGLIQSLYAIGLSLEESRRLTEEDLAESRVRLGQTVEDVNNVIRQVRQHLAVSHDTTLFSASRLKNELRRVANAMARADSMHIDLNVETRAAACLTTEERREVLYIAQEAMSNSLRHASASVMRVALRMERDRVRLEVEDNGGGFDRKAVAGTGNGLRNMEQRASRIGARVELVSRLRHGTRVRLDVPIREESALESHK